MVDSLNQQNFQQALGAGYATLRMLAAEAGELTEPPTQLASVSTEKLQRMAWDLEAIQTAIRTEVNRRSDGPIDTASSNG